MSAVEPEPAADERTRGGRAAVRRGLVEQEIFDQAARLFADRGFSGASFQDIADAVGLTRPALYHYVKSKDDLLTKLVAEITEDSATSIDAILRRTDLDSAARLREIVSTLSHRQGEHAARFRLIIRSEADLPSDVAEVHAANRRAILRSVATAIEQGVADGTFRPVDARVAALGILGQVNWIAWWFNADSDDNLDHIAAQMAETAVAGLVDAGGAQAVDSPQAAISAVRASLDRLEHTLTR